MKLVVGLGNPGRRYEQSRHNVGYSVVDELARRLRMDLTRYDRSFEGVVGEASAADQRLLLLKPATFMNCSGRSVAAVRSFYKLSPSDILVAYDDLDLEVGQIRLRAGGSGGGHRGMTDILKALDTADVPRLSSTFWRASSRTNGS
jgi:PTH1 family peptidyl-tRNA hydrolase